VDSAENIFFQAGSELGVIGIGLILWIGYEIFMQVRIILKSRARNSENRFLYIGVASGLCAIFFNFMFHSYIGSFEVKYGFWLLVAFILFLSRNDQFPKRKCALSFRSKMPIIILSTTFGVVGLWNSAHSLSLANESDEYGWNQNFGLYGLEEDSRKFVFQWAEKTAGYSIENIGTDLIVPMLASHPDIQSQPVHVKVFLSNRNFQAKSLIKDLVFSKNEWQDVELKFNKNEGNKIYLIFETDRSWQPEKYLRVSDRRNLGVGLGQAWFKYPSIFPEDRIRNIRTLLADMWDGPMKKALWTNGISSITFIAEEPLTVLRLWVRGQKALGIGPYVNIRLDEKIIGRSQIIEEGILALVFSVRANKGRHKLSVEFVNDFFDKKSGEDRNVFLGNLDLLYLNQ